MYLQESNYNIGAENDLKMFSQAMSCKDQIYGTIPWKMRWILWNLTKFEILLSWLMVQKP